MYDYEPRIFVRSYKRSHLILDKTLGMLLKQKDLNHGNQIYLVVANHEERKLYEEALGDYPLADIIVSEVGGEKAIEYAVKSAPEGEPVLFFDDDLHSMKYWSDLEDSKSLGELDNLGYHLNNVFSVMQKSQYGSTFAFNMISNFMFKKSSPYLRFGIGHLAAGFFGGFNQDAYITDQAHENDNIINSRMIEKDGGIFVLNSFTCKYDFGNLEGGMQETDRGDSQKRKDETYHLCKRAQENNPSVEKYFKEEPVYNEGADCYSLKKKNANTIKKMLGIPYREKLPFWQTETDVEKYLNSEEEGIFNMEEWT